MKMYSLVLLFPTAGIEFGIEHNRLLMLRYFKYMILILGRNKEE